MLYASPLYDLLHISYGFNILFTYRYSRFLEEGSFRGKTADFFYMFLFGGFLMTVSCEQIFVFQSRNIPSLWLIFSVIMNKCSISVTCIFNFHNWSPLSSQLIIRSWLFLWAQFSWAMHLQSCLFMFGADAIHS